MPGLPIPFYPWPDLIDSDNNPGINRKVSSSPKRPSAFPRKPANESRPLQKTTQAHLDKVESKPDTLKQDASVSEVSSDPKRTSTKPDVPEVE